MTSEASLKEEWDDKEIETFMRRSARFLKMGMTEMESERLATEMLQRDRPVSGDDRRLCLECSGFDLKRAACKRPGMLALPTVLQRCDGFALRGAA